MSSAFLLKDFWFSKIGPHGRKRALLLFLFFFSVIAIFWTLKPMRTTEVIKTFGIEMYPLFKQSLVFFVPFVLIFYSKMTEILSRPKLVYLFTIIFTAGNIAFWFLFHIENAAWVKAAFFFYIDMYVTVMVALFWTYINDLFKPNYAKLVYGFVGAGGLVGGVVGSSISGWAGSVLKNNIILAAVPFFALIVFCVFMVERDLKKDPKAPDRSQPVLNGDEDGINPEESSMTRQFKAGILAIMKSPYLISIVVMVGCYEIISTIIDFQFNASSDAIFHERERMASFQGRVSFFAQLVALGVQLFVTTPVHRKFGVTPGLLFLPLTLMLGTTAFLIFPVLWAITLTIGSEAVFSYSIHQSSKEMLYVPLDKTSKFKGKAFIDMFVYRLAKFAGALILILYTLVLQDHGWTSRGLMLIVFIVLVPWIFATIHVGKSFKRNPRTATEARAQTLMAPASS